MKQKSPPRILVMIMAGGKGERLMPLTARRSKPAVPFGGKFRIIDFVLSNFLNSGFMAIYVLVQYRSLSLIEHMRRAWRIGGRIRQNFITVVPPQMKSGGTWYEGTADAVYQNMNLIRDFEPDLVAIFGADHIYRMDVSQMVRFHLAREAVATVAALPAPLEVARDFGVISVNRDGQIFGFDEKPEKPNPIPGDPDRAYCSMGNYLFNTEVLVEILEVDAQRSSTHDFGSDILPNLIHSHQVTAYNFLENEIPGLQPYEERGYWRDVGTLEAYWKAHMDLLGEFPVFDLRNVAWPIMTDIYDGPSASLIASHFDNTMIGGGSQVVDAEVHRSIVGSNVQIGHGARIKECVILDGTVIGAKTRLKKVIAERFSVIPSGSEIGFDLAKDAERYQVEPSGIVVISRGNLRFGRADRIST